MFGKNCTTSRVLQAGTTHCAVARAYSKPVRAAVFCDSAGKSSLWGWLRHCPVTENDQKGLRVDREAYAYWFVCGSLREVHLLLRGVLQTRHQVTVSQI
jgi:hypothetical protein